MQKRMRNYAIETRKNVLKTDECLKISKLKQRRTSVYYKLTQSMNNIRSPKKARFTVTVLKTHDNYRR